MKKVYLSPRNAEAVSAYLQGRVRPKRISPHRWLALVYHYHFEQPYISTSELRAIADGIGWGIMEELAQ